LAISLSFEYLCNRTRAYRISLVGKSQEAVDGFKQIFRLVERARLKAHLHVLPRKDGVNISTAVGFIGGCFVKGEDKQAIRLKLRLSKERRDIGFEPSVCRRECAVVAVVVVVWDYEREVRQGAVRFISGELREREEVARFV
jgi:hypothetical protein